MVKQVSKRSLSGGVTDGSSCAMPMSRASGPQSPRAIAHSISWAKTGVTSSYGPTWRMNATRIAGYRRIAPSSDSLSRARSCRTSRPPSKWSGSGAAMRELNPLVSRNSDGDVPNVRVKARVNASWEP